MDERHCPSRQELCTSCLQELIRAVQRRTVPLLDWMLCRWVTILPTVITFCMSIVVVPVPNLIFILARTSHQPKFLRMFPSIYYLPYTPVCTYCTRQVLNLSRFVDPCCTYLRWQVMNLSPFNCNIFIIFYYIYHASRSYKARTYTVTCCRYTCTSS